MTNEHKLKTIEDIVEVVNINNLDNFIIDFKNFLSSRIVAKEITKIGVIEIQTAVFFHWIDDGKNETQINIQFSSTPPTEE